MDVELDHIDIRVYGPRNQLLGQTHIPVHLVPEFRELLLQAQHENPIYNPGLLMRWMVKLGYKATKKSLAQGQVELHPGT
jgi:hypothetical protein